MRIRTVSEFEALSSEVRARQDATRRWISICGGTSCSASEARPVRKALEEAIAKHRLKKKVGLKLTGCHGFCEHGPLVVVSPDGVCYERVKPEDAPEIIEHEGEYYIASLLPSLKGIQIARLRWRER